MTWILEEPIYIVILGVVTLAFLGFALMQTGYRPLLHAMLGVVALTIGLLILEHSVVTKREQVETALHAMARDVESNDLDAILSHVYSGAPNVRANAERVFPRYKFNEVRIKNNVKVTFEKNANPPEVLATFNVVVDVVYAGVHYPRQPAVVDVTLIQENGQWRVAKLSARAYVPGGSHTHEVTIEG